MLLGRVSGLHEGDGEGGGLGDGLIDGEGEGVGLEHEPIKNSGQVRLMPLSSVQASSTRSSIEHTPKGSSQPANSVVKASSLHKQV